jgi:type II secretory pathway component PulJ
MKTQVKTDVWRGGAAGFVLSEMMIATLIFSLISVGLLMAFTSLTRSYSATTDFAANHADQMRISDYIALDLRRALAVTAATNNTTISIPSYYATDGTVQTPTLDGNGGVNYGGTGSSVTVRYYLSGDTIYRQEGTATPVALATNVGDFKFSVTDAGKVVSTQITFDPTYRSGTVSTAVTLATSFYNTTLLRNSRRDMVSGVY